ncbi:MAG: tryptophan--tRNA ligase [Bacteroidales bacterium]|nr:tryptophan--tRNA ligase [Bacteroidales bacterium]
MKEVVLSGIRSTGHLHLGNYFGALRNFVQMQHEYRCYFFVADWHSLTTHPTPEDHQGNVRTVISEYLACGIDPDVATLYVQSDVPEIAELYLLLNMNAYVGELERTTTFKEKVRKQPENVNAGLLTYPVLMAADIIIHKANKVPVGKDQEQNLEMARKFAKRFNRIYGVDFFIEPKGYSFSGKLIKIPGLDGSGKMGKSEGNALNLADDPEVIRQKVMRAVTDAGPTHENQTPPEPIQNLFQLMEVASQPDVIAYYRKQYAECKIRYGEMKSQLADDLIRLTAPIRERITDIQGDEEYLRKIVRQGAEKARESASKTLREVKEIMGFKPF